MPCKNTIRYRNYDDSKELYGIRSGETVIKIYKNEPIAYVYTRDVQMSIRMNNMCKKYPDYYWLLELKKCQKTNGRLRVYAMKKDRVRFRRVATEEDLENFRKTVPYYQEKFKEQVAERARHVNAEPPHYEV